MEYIKSHWIIAGVHKWREAKNKNNKKIMESKDINEFVDAGQMSAKNVELQKQSILDKATK